MQWYLLLLYAIIRIFYKIYTIQSVQFGALYFAQPQYVNEHAMHIDVYICELKSKMKSSMHEQNFTQKVINME